MPVTLIFLFSFERLNCIRWGKYQLEYANTNSVFPGGATTLMGHAHSDNQGSITAQLLLHMTFLSGCYWLNELDTDSS